MLAHRAVPPSGETVARGVKAKMWKVVLVVVVIWFLISVAGFCGTLFWLDEENEANPANVLSAAQVWTQVAGGGIAIAGLLALLAQLTATPKLTIAWEAIGNSWALTVMNRGRAAANGVRLNLVLEAKDWDLLDWAKGVDWEWEEHDRKGTQMIGRMRRTGTLEPASSSAAVLRVDEKRGAADWMYVHFFVAGDNAKPVTYDERSPCVGAKLDPQT